MRIASCAVAIAALVSPALAAAQDSTPAAPSSDERRLTPEQIEEVLAAAAAKRAVAGTQLSAPAPVADPSEPTAAFPVHGEVGFSVGSGGYREVFGTGVYPLGQDGVAAISLNFVDWGHRRFAH